jgi:hypothetical protein
MELRNPSSLVKPNRRFSLHKPAVLTANGFFEGLGEAECLDDIDRKEEK